MERKILMGLRKCFVTVICVLLLLCLIACSSMPALTSENEDDSDNDNYHEVPLANQTTATSFQQVTKEPVIIPTESGLTKFKPYPDEKYILYYDPEVWSERNPIDCTTGYMGYTLEHNILHRCYIEAFQFSYDGSVHFHDPVLRYINGRNWMESKYGVLTYLGDNNLQLSFGDSDMRENPECRKAMEAVLGTLHVEGESTIKETQFPTYTPTPVYVCPNAPKVIHSVGYSTYTLTSVLLRSSPEKRGDNIIAHLKPETEISISDGPVCGPYDGGAYSYFYVTIHSGDYVGLEGWLAEGDLQQYYMAHYWGRN